MVRQERSGMLRVGVLSWGLVRIGLKFIMLLSLATLCGVAPFAGAWIEIHEIIISRVMNTSLPSRERGLK